MDGKRRWFGWIAIGLGALALAVALLSRGFGPQMGAASWPGANMQQQQNAQPNAGQQNAQPGPNAQPGAGQQNAGPPVGRGQQNAGPQNGPGAGPQAGSGGEARREGGRPGDGGFGMGGWLRMPFRLIGGAFQWAMLALLIGFGVWMLRGRTTATASNTAQAEPAQAAPPAPLSPTGEAYVDEPSDRE